jgi:hypothetical protein
MPEVCKHTVAMTAKEDGEVREERNMMMCGTNTYFTNRQLGRLSETPVTTRKRYSDI